MYGNVLVLVQFQVLHTLCYKFRFAFSPQPFGVWRNKALELLSTYIHDVHCLDAIFINICYTGCSYAMVSVAFGQLCVSLAFAIIFPRVFLPTAMLTYQMFSVMFRTFLGVANFYEVKFTQVKLKCSNRTVFFTWNKVNLTKALHWQKYILYMFKYYL